MNRLILVGNGFDLAHGLKTSYKDFILDLFKKEIGRILNIEEKPKSDGYIYNPVKIGGHLLFQTKVTGDFYERVSLKGDLENITDFKKLVRFINDREVDISFPENSKEITTKGGKKITENYPETIIQRTYDNMTKRSYNWVDIEGMYYDSLLKIVNAKDENGNITYNDSDKENVKFINLELCFLKEKLAEYLNEVTKISYTLDNEAQAHFWDGFNGQFIEREIQRLELKEGDYYPQNVYILNFNYTDTIYKYGNNSNSFENREAHVDYNFIHGNIKNIDKNPIIFGYGDETDDNYDVIEKLNDNELLRHIKSFGYFKTDNYYRLLRFIEQPEGYQVFVVGHSCGLSDRVMLKRIFEHKNCKSIQIFYHRKCDGTDDYTEKTQEISRHFDHKNEMREKIVPKIHCSPMDKLIRELFG